MNNPIDSCIPILHNVYVICCICTCIMYKYTHTELYVYQNDDFDHYIIHMHGFQSMGFMGFMGFMNLYGSPQLMKLDQ